MKRLSFFALFLILLIGVSLTSCNFNGSNDVPISVNEDSSLKELKKKYESLVNEKSVLQDRLLNLTSSYSSLQTEITKLTDTIDDIYNKLDSQLITNTQYLDMISSKYYISLIKERIE